MSGIRVTDEPIVARSQTGSVHVQLNPDTWATWRTEEHFRSWREALDRDEISFDLDRWRTPTETQR